MARKFKIKVDNLTLPGAGMAPGVVSGRPFALKDEIVSEKELGSHLLGLHDHDHDRTKGLVEEVTDDQDAKEARENPGSVSVQSGESLTVAGQGSGEGLTEPWEGYDDQTADDIVDRLKGAPPETVEKVRAYERLQSTPRDAVLDYTPLPQTGSASEEQ